MAESENSLPHPTFPVVSEKKYSKNVSLAETNTISLDHYLHYIGQDIMKENYNKKMKNGRLEKDACEEEECRCDVSQLAAKDVGEMTDNMENVFKCSACGKLFKTGEELQKHNTSPLGRWLTRIKRKYSQ